MNAGAGVVLVVEDDPDCLEAVASVLEFDGYTVIPAQNGLDALRYLEANPVPDLILLDVAMPVMDGPQFLLEQKRRPWLTSIPIVLLSAERSLAQQAAELPVDGYLPKPVQMDEFLSAVHRVISAGRRGSRELCRR